jgi:hypothetical protein
VHYQPYIACLWNEELILEVEVGCGEFPLQYSALGHLCLALPTKYNTVKDARIRVFIVSLFNSFFCPVYIMRY